jgi:osmotically-inducible protein OsmY
MSMQLSLASLVLAATVAACAAPSSEDMKLSSDVERSINTHPALQADLLRAQAVDHVVYLSGSADTWLEYYDAEEAARTVPGVLRVVNKIEVKGVRA